ncbi:MAG: GDP-L-colitose synthase [Elusimicrobia bacterium]|nr:GDP-L-colitose synthase [Elusimicrobiota bacterium]
MTRKKILVTGSTGLLGTAVKNVAGTSLHSFTFIDRKDADLENASDIRQLIESVRPDVILHLAAVVGGIKYNMEKPEELLDKNRRINQNLLNSALSCHVPKVISILSTCIFPNDAPEPWSEKMIHQGEVDRRQWGYAQAKRELDLMSREITRSSGGKNTYVSLVPSTLYGENDNYDPEKSHVLPAVLQKIYDAKLKGADVTFWGSGKPRREFTYATDMAHILLWAVDHFDDPEPMIISPSSDISVRELVDDVTHLLNFKGTVYWDASQPDGRFSRKTDVSKFRRLLPDFKMTSFNVGLKAMVEDFCKRFPQVRGLQKRGEVMAK